MSGNPGPDPASAAESERRLLAAVQRRRSLAGNVVARVVAWRGSFAGPVALGVGHGTLRPLSAFEPRIPAPARLPALLGLGHRMRDLRTATPVEAFWWRRLAPTAAMLARRLPPRRRDSADPGATFPELGPTLLAPAVLPQAPSALAADAARAEDQADGEPGHTALPLAAPPATPPIRGAWWRRLAAVLAPLAGEPRPGAARASTPGPLPAAEPAATGWPLGPLQAEAPSAAAGAQAPADQPEQPAEEVAPVVAAAVTQPPPVEARPPSWQWHERPGAASHAPAVADPAAEQPSAVGTAGAGRGAAVLPPAPGVVIAPLAAALTRRRDLPHGPPPTDAPLASPGRLFWWPTGRAVTASQAVIAAAAAPPGLARMAQQVHQLVALPAVRRRQTLARPAESDRWTAATAAQLGRWRVRVGAATMPASAPPAPAPATSSDTPDGGPGSYQPPVAAAVHAPAALADRSPAAEEPPVHGAAPRAAAASRPAAPATVGQRPGVAPTPLAALLRGLAGRLSRTPATEPDAEPVGARGAADVAPGQATGPSGHLEATTARDPLVGELGEAVQSPGAAPSDQLAGPARRLALQARDTRAVERVARPDPRRAEHAAPGPARRVPRAGDAPLGTSPREAASPGSQPGEAAIAAALPERAWQASDAQLAEVIGQLPAPMAAAALARGVLGQPVELADLAPGRPLAPSAARRGAPQPAGAQPGAWAATARPVLPPASASGWRPPAAALHAPAPIWGGGGPTASSTTGGASGVQRAPIERDLAAPALGPSPPAPPAAAPTRAAAAAAEPDLDQLAEDVLARLRWRLAAERERMML